MVAYRPPLAPLFVPANRPDRIAKAVRSGTDAIIVDLEDSVPPSEKDAARHGLSDYLADCPVPVWLRINACGTLWWEQDLEAARALPLAGLMLPKAENPVNVPLLASQKGSTLPIILLIETARGLANIAALCAVPHIAQLAFGSVDFALDLGCAHERDALLLARSSMVFQGCLAGLPPPLDGVTTKIADLTVLSGDCLHACALGFGGKMAIHPTQISTIRSAFLPSETEIRWAERVIEADAQRGGKATQVDGQMTDKPMVERARQILVKSRQFMFLESNLFGK